MIDNFIPIPDWDHRGLLPPLLGEPTLAGSSPPFPVRLTETALRFADSLERRRLFLGFLDFRQALYDAGLTDGFQLVDGSYVEDTLQRRGRDPADIDLVTFFRTPQGKSQSEMLTSFPDLFDSRITKERYGVDAYFVGLDNEDQFYLTKAIAFWNNLWHHTREGERKGYLAIDLSNAEDTEARAIVGQLMENEAGA